MVIQFTDEMKQLINHALADGFPCLVATASVAGIPGVGYRGSMMVFDDTHLAWWERSKKDGFEHIGENPNVVVMYRNTNPESRRIWKIHGTATMHATGPVRDQVLMRTVPRELAADQDLKGVAVLVEVSKVANYNGQAIMAKDAVLQTA